MKTAETGLIRNIFGVQKFGASNFMTDTKSLKGQSGRTMVEMLGTLILIGILSVAAVSFFRYFLDKNRATEIIKFISMKHSELVIKINKIPRGWESVQIPLKSYDFYTMYDVQRNDYVKVANIEQGVCQQLLKLVDGKKILMYDVEDNLFTECEDENEIIFAFNEATSPTECLTRSDCGEGFEGLCKDGHCVGCEGSDIFDTNRAKCVPVCDGNTELTCYNEADVWCCGEGLICGDGLTPETKCIDGGGVCQYSFGEITEDTIYYTDCYYEIGASVTTESKKIGNSTVTVLEPSVSSNTARGGCPANKYCLLYWSESDWSVNGTEPKLTGWVSDQYVYGRCQGMLSVDTRPLVRNDVGNGFFDVKQGCPKNQYCLLKWREESCEDATTSDIYVYGICVDMNKKTGDCPY